MINIGREFAAYIIHVSLSTIKEISDCDVSLFKKIKISEKCLYLAGSKMCGFFPESGNLLKER